MREFLYFIIFIQSINLVVSVEAYYDNHVAFLCGKPSMVFQKFSWIADYKQDCIKDELSILPYCQLKFPGKNIISAEPAIERYIFKKWCDFKGKNCQFNITIRPFKCLATPGESENTNVKENNFRPFIIEGVLETEDEEEGTYQRSLKNFNKLKQEWKRRITKDYIISEKKLKRNWWNHPRNSIKNEKELISKFKSEYIGMNFRLKDREEKLLSFHDNRLKLIFNTKLGVAMRKLTATLRKPWATEVEIREAMVTVLDLLMLRKKEIREDRLRDKSLNNLLIPNLDEELKIIDINITGVYNQLEKVPQYKIPIKQYLLVHIMKKFPRTSFEDTQSTDILPEMDDIIARYKYRQVPEVDDKSVIQYHNIHDRDQHGPQDNSITDKYSNPSLGERLFTGRNLTMIMIICIFVTLAMLVFMAVIMIRYRTRIWKGKHCHSNYRRPSTKHIISTMNPNFLGERTRPDYIHSKLCVVDLKVDQDYQDKTDGQAKPLIN